MYIEGHWETVETLQDISRVIECYYNHELANKLDELIEEIEEKNSEYDFERMLELEEIIGGIQNLVRCV